MINKKLGIIGVGNMGSAIAVRLLEKKAIAPSDLYLVDDKFKDIEELLKIKKQISKIQIKNQKEDINISDDFKRIIDKIEIILLAIKPQVFPTLLPEMKKYIKDKLIISIAAGIPISYIKNYLGQNVPVVRVMPNLCAMVGESMSVWVSSIEVSEDKELIAREMLRATGREVKLSGEELIDAATAVSGSGPAYVFYLTELLESNAREMGFDADAAVLLAKQTVIGSAKFLANSDKTPKELRMNVTSKGGTTEAAFKIFDEINLRSVFNKGIRAAWKRAKELTS